VIGLHAGTVGDIAVLGAHCDDIAIGMGGTLLTLARANPGLRVHALVLSGAGSARETEERAALQALCPDAQVR
jgi:LmbE family N-acetylglucosaminyl deacetylase